MKITQILAWCKKYPEMVAWSASGVFVSIGIMSAFESLGAGLIALGIVGAITTFIFGRRER